MANPASLTRISRLTPARATRVFRTFHGNAGRLWILVFTRFLNANRIPLRSKALQDHPESRYHQLQDHAAGSKNDASCGAASEKYFPARLFSALQTVWM